MRQASPDPLDLVQFEEETNHSESDNGLSGSLNESEMRQSLDDDNIMDAGADSNNAESSTCKDDDNST